MRHDALLNNIDKYYTVCKTASESDAIVDLTGINDFSYSAVMRRLRQECSPEIVQEFLDAYKQCFDALVINQVEDPSQVALQFAIKMFSVNHPVSIEIKKEAQYSNSTLVGKYLADIIKFTLNRISPEKRPKSINTLKRKIYLLNENELANKNLPASSSMGQAITFVKNVLFNHNPRYIREVLNSVVKFL